MSLPLLQRPRIDYSQSVMIDSLRTLIVEHPRASQRFFEILPGFVSWNIILFPLWGSFVVPWAVAAFIIVYYVYWLFRSVLTALRAFVAHRRIQRCEVRDYLSELVSYSDADKIRHLVVIPTYREPGHILLRTLEALRSQTVGAEKLIPVIAFEERAGEEINASREVLLREHFGGVFANLLFTRHPKDLFGEVVGKSSNMAWASRELKKLIDAGGNWNKDYLTISSVDADICFHKNHFAALSLHFLKSENRNRRIWQGALMFYNNIDKIPGVMRVFNRLFTVVSISGLMRQDGLINFSTYSLSWNLLEEIGFWDVDVIPEDFRVFFKAYFATEGQTQVEPIFLPVYADAAEDQGFWSTFVNTYEQVKRWAWGVSDDSYILKRAILDTKTPRLKKTFRVLRVLEVHFLWPVNWFLLTLGLTVLSGINPSFMATRFGHLLPILSGWILTPTFWALILITLVDLRSQPNFRNLPLWRKIVYPLEVFLFLPISGLFFSALPSLDAHTRLLMGRYLEYRVTEKV